MGDNDWERTAFSAQKHTCRSQYRMRELPDPDCLACTPKASLPPQDSALREKLAKIVCCGNYKVKGGCILDNHTSALATADRKETT